MAASKQNDAYGNPIDPEDPNQQDPWATGGSLPTPSPSDATFGDPKISSPTDPAPPVIENPAAPAPTAPTGSAPAGLPGNAPSGGSLTDPAYVDSLISYYGKQNGVNPSVANDPTYWRRRVLSGAFGNDQDYLVKRFFTPEGAPETGAPDTSGLDAALSRLLGIQPSAFGQNIRSQITSGIADASKPVDMNSPEVTGPQAAFAATAQAARRQAQQAAAERAYAEGDTTGAMDAATMGGFENLGRSEASFNANNVADLYKQNRAKLQNLLQMGTGILNAEETRQIQAEMAAIDAELRKLGVNTQNQQFYDSLAAGLGEKASSNDQAASTLFA